MQRGAASAGGGHFLISNSTNDFFMQSLFRAHEWEKHGTCAEELFPREADYFNTTLQLHAQHSLEVRLSPPSILAAHLVACFQPTKTL